METGLCSSWGKEELRLSVQQIFRTQGWEETMDLTQGAYKGH